MAIRELGWVPKENYHHHFPDDHNNRDPTPVAFRTNEYGFRHWGDLRSDKPRILFVGDSFTYAENVSDQQAYYASSQIIFRSRFLRRAVVATVLYKASLSKEILESDSTTVLCPPVLLK